MVPPPFYADLDKNTRDVLSKGYNYGLLKLDVKTRTVTGVELEVSGVQNLENKNVVANLQTKYRFKDYGVAFAEKWNTDNQLAIETIFSDLCEGAKMSCELSMIPTSFYGRREASRDDIADAKTQGSKMIKLRGEYRNTLCAVNLESEFKAGGPLTSLSAVLGYGGWHFGAGSSFDQALEKFLIPVETKFAMGFITKDFILNTSITKGTLFSGSIFHKVNPHVDLGVMISWSAETSISNFELGCQIQLEPDTSLRFKVNDKAHVGMGYCHQFGKGVTLCLSGEISAMAFKTGGSKIGVSLELEP